MNSSHFPADFSGPFDHLLCEISNSLVQQEKLGNVVKLGSRISVFQAHIGHIKGETLHMLPWPRGPQAFWDRADLAMTFWQGIH